MIFMPLLRRRAPLRFHYATGCHATLAAAATAEALRQIILTITPFAGRWLLSGATALLFICAAIGFRHNLRCAIYAIFLRWRFRHLMMLSLFIAAMLLTLRCCAIIADIAVIAADKKLSFDVFAIAFHALLRRFIFAILMPLFLI